MPDRRRRAPASCAQVHEGGILVEQKREEAWWGRSCVIVYQPVWAIGETSFDTWGALRDNRSHPAGSLSFHRRGIRRIHLALYLLIEGHAVSTRELPK